MKEQTPNREDGPEKKREKTNEEQTNEGGEVSTCGFIPFSSRPSLSITYNLKRLFIRCVFEREAIIFSIQREGEEESIKWGRTRKLQSWSSGPWSGRRLSSPAQNFAPLLSIRPQAKIFGATPLFILLESGSCVDVGGVEELGLHWLGGILLLTLVL